MWFSLKEKGYEWKDLDQKWGRESSNMNTECRRLAWERGGIAIPPAKLFYRMETDIKTSDNLQRKKITTVLLVLHIFLQASVRSLLNNSIYSIKCLSKISFSSLEEPAYFHEIHVSEVDRSLPLSSHSLTYTNKSHLIVQQSFVLLFLLPTSR